MIVPDSILVAGRVVPIKMLRTVQRGAEVVDGMYSEGEDNIRISETQSDAGRFETLWHEAMHAALARHRVVPLGDEEEEAMVTGFSQIVVDLLRDNPLMRVPPDGVQG